MSAQHKFKTGDRFVINEKYGIAPDPTFCGSGDTGTVLGSLGGGGIYSVKFDKSEVEIQFCNAVWMEPLATPAPEPEVVLELQHKDGAWVLEDHQTVAVMVRSGALAHKSTSIYTDGIVKTYVVNDGPVEYTVHDMRKHDLMTEYPQDTAS